MIATLPKPGGVPDPDAFASLGANFMAAKLLCTGVELGVFEKLADGPLTIDELVAATGLPRRSLRVVANGLVALDVLERHGDRYANAEATQAFLSGRGERDLRPGLRLYNHVIYPMWMQFEQVVRTGQPARPVEGFEKFARIFSEGVEAWTLLGAHALVEKYDFSQHRRLLDVGGGTGSYLIPILGRWPSLRATLYELPQTAALARRRLAAEAVRDRIDLVEGDVLFDPIPDGHDAVLMAGFIHLFGPEKIARMLGRIRERVAPGTRLLIVDQWMDETHARPVLGAMLAATYLMLAGDGDTYSLDEARPWLEESGFRVLGHTPLAGVISLVTAEAR